MTSRVSWKLVIHVPGTLLVRPCALAQPRRVNTRGPRLGASWLQKCSTRDMSTPDILLSVRSHSLPTMSCWNLTMGTRARRMRWTSETPGTT
uniref:Putative secreted protein n=1 Tax=Ixodes ricinus TaxID=34613 RepID=A0A6B0UC99_IXORI